MAFSKSAQMRGEFGAIRRSIEGEAPSSVGDCLKVGGGEILEPVGEGRDTGICIKSDAIEALGSALAGSDRPLIVTSGTALVAPGRLATEEDVPASRSTSFPRVSEETAASVAARGVRASVVRLPQVHDRVKQGLVTYMIALAREKGVSAFVADGLNRWPAVHRLDAAHLYRLVLEKGSAGARYHAVAEEQTQYFSAQLQLVQARLNDLDSVVALY